MSNELLSIAEMYEADRLTMADYVSGVELMENAGRACSDAICDRLNPGHATILCGPGNNGGDGFVIARHLKEAGWQIRLGLLGDVTNLKGDAAHMASLWKGEVLPITPDLGEGTDLVVDALFGAGLSKPIEGAVREVLERASDSGAYFMAVDTPSGIEGDSGQILGYAPQADLTVTFCRKKTGHLLMPGRLHCGELIVADIGIPDEVINQIEPQAAENAYEDWAPSFPMIETAGHKYGRGHAVTVSGGVSSTGAARLAARGALRIGAGLVSVASPKSALIVNASHLTTEMVKPFEGAEGLSELLSDPRFNAIVIGPGQGITEQTKELVSLILGKGRACVLDADALTSFEKSASELIDLLHENAVITPHEGEFKRLFPGLLEESANKLTAVRKAASQSGAIVVLKGSDTVIAEPSGFAVINSNAPPYLATAGSGDVLAGFICGLLAQGMTPFEAACAGVWLHGECGNQLGRGLIAEDLPEVLPGILQILDAVNLETDDLLGEE